MHDWRTCLSAADAARCNDGVSIIVEANDRRDDNELFEIYLSLLLCDPQRHANICGRMKPAGGYTLPLAGCRTIALLDLHLVVRHQRDCLLLGDHVAQPRVHCSVLLGAALYRIVFWQKPELALVQW